MFQTRPTRRIAVVVHLSDGQSIEATVEAGIAGTLAAVLNREGDFVMLETTSGSILHVAKAAILTLRETGTAAPTGPAPCLPDIADEPDEACQVLGVAPAAPPDEVREAFFRRSWQYDAALAAGERLAPEIRDYALAMRMRIGAAYARLAGGAGRAPRPLAGAPEGLTPAT